MSETDSGQIEFEPDGVLRSKGDSSLSYIVQHYVVQADCLITVDESLPGVWKWVVRIESLDITDGSGDKIFKSYQAAFSDAKSVCDRMSYSKVIGRHVKTNIFRDLPALPKI